MRVNRAVQRASSCRFSKYGSRERVDIAQPAAGDRQHRRKIRTSRRYLVRLSLRLLWRLAVEWRSRANTFTACTISGGVIMPRRSASRPLEGKVSIVGVRPQVSLTDRRAKVADLSITLTGGSGPTPVPITFSISLNVPLSGGAQLTDGAGTVLAESTRSGSAQVFRDVPVIPPGSRSRVRSKM
jgi:hypothetical protein